MGMYHCLIIFKVFFLSLKVTCANLQHMIISIVQQDPYHWYLKTHICISCTMFNVKHIFPNCVQDIFFSLLLNYCYYKKLIPGQDILELISVYFRGNGNWYIICKSLNFIFYTWEMVNNTKINILISKRKLVF